MYYRPLSPVHWPLATLMELEAWVYPVHPFLICSPYVHPKSPLFFPLGSKSHAANLAPKNLCALPSLPISLTLTDSPLRIKELNLSKNIPDGPLSTVNRSSQSRWSLCSALSFSWPWHTSFSQHQLYRKPCFSSLGLKVKFSSGPRAFWSTFYQQTSLFFLSCFPTVLHSSQSRFLSIYLVN